MKKLYVSEKETGMKITEVDSILEGLTLISQFENDDKLDNNYKKDFYDIVDEDYCTVDINEEIKKELDGKKWGDLSEYEIENLFYYFNYNIVDFTGNNINEGAGILDFEFGLSIPCLIDIDSIFVEEDEMFYNPAN